MGERREKGGQGREGKSHKSYNLSKTVGYFQNILHIVRYVVECAQVVRSQQLRCI